MEFDKNILASLHPDLVDLMEEHAMVDSFPKGTQILRQHQYVKTVPIVLKGVLKVYSTFGDKELLLYYVESSESCVMTFYAGLKNTPSKVFANVEEDVELLLIPVQYLTKWIKAYPDLNDLFYTQFNKRYSDLVDTIGQLLMDKMDKRLYDHLKKKSALAEKDTIRINHNELARELGTAREVITRMVKKLEIEEKVEQSNGEIKIIADW